MDSFNYGKWYDISESLSIMILPTGWLLSDSKIRQNTYIEDSHHDNWNCFWDMKEKYKNKDKNNEN